MKISEKTQIIESVHYLTETKDPDDPSSFKRNISDMNLPEVAKGDRMRVIINPDRSVGSGALLKSATAVFEGATPLINSAGEPVFKAHFQKQGVRGLVWLSEPLTKPGRFDFNLIVELEDYDAYRPAKGNHKIVIWPMMVVDDDPPDKAKTI